VTFQVFTAVNIFVEVFWITTTCSLKIWFTERRSKLVNAPASYSGGPGFTSRPGDRLSWLRGFVVFLSLYIIIGWYLKLGHRFFPYPYPICRHPVVDLYNMYKNQSTPLNFTFNVIFNFQFLISTEVHWDCFIGMKTQLCTHSRGRFVLLCVLVSHLKMVVFDRNMSWC
jgi:hypothetical protein